MCIINMFNTLLVLIMETHIPLDNTSVQDTGSQTYTPDDMLLVVNHLVSVTQRHSNRTIDGIMRVHDNSQFEEALI